MSNLYYLSTVGIQTEHTYWNKLLVYGNSVILDMDLTSVKYVQYFSIAIFFMHLPSREVSLFCKVYSYHLCVSNLHEQQTLHQNLWTSMLLLHSTLLKRPSAWTGVPCASSADLCQCAFVFSLVILKRILHLLLLLFNFFPLFVSFFMCFF